MLIHAVELEGLESKQLNSGQYVPTCAEYCKRQEASIGIVKSGTKEHNFSEELRSQGDKLRDGFFSSQSGYDVALPNSTLSRTFVKESTTYTEEKIGNTRWLTTTRTVKTVNVKYGDVGSPQEGQITDVTEVTVSTAFRQKIVKGNSASGYTLSSKGGDFQILNTGKPDINTNEIGGTIDNLGKIQNLVGEANAMLVFNDLVNNANWSKKAADKVIKGINKMGNWAEK